MNDTTPLQIMIQAGGFGMAAYLVWWLTRKLNGKFDRLADALHKLAENTQSMERSIKANTDATNRLSNSVNRNSDGQ